MPSFRKKGRSAIHRAEYRELLARLREARDEAGMTQAEVAERLGRPQSFVAKVESGERRIDPIDLWEFASIYRRSVEYFLPDSSSVTP